LEKWQNCTLSKIANEGVVMRVVGLIPFRLKTDKIPNQNIKELGGIPLVNYTIRVLNRVSLIDDVYIFGSEDTICDYVLDGLKYHFLQRTQNLDTEDTTTQDIISEFLEIIDADIIVLLHIASPFLTFETITDCIENVKSGKFNSAFTAFEISKFCWFQGQPLNYSLGEPTPRTQDLESVIVEQSSLYVFNTEEFRKTGQRISAQNYIRVIDHFEGHDIDSVKSFEVAELIVNTGMFGIR